MNLQAGLILPWQATAELAGLGGRILGSRDALARVKSVGEANTSSTLLWNEANIAAWKFDRAICIRGRFEGKVGIVSLEGKHTRAFA